MLVDVKVLPAGGSDLHTITCMSAGRPADESQRLKMGLPDKHILNLPPPPPIK